MILIEEKGRINLEDANNRKELLQVIPDSSFCRKYKKLTDGSKQF
jgi:hypothetical protein